MPEQSPHDPSAISSDAAEQETQRLAVAAEADTSAQATRRLPEPADDDTSAQATRRLPEPFDDDSSVRETQRLPVPLDEDETEALTARLPASKDHASMTFPTRTSSSAGEPDPAGPLPPIRAMVSVTERAIMRRAARPLPAIARSAEPLIIPGGSLPARKAPLVPHRRHRVRHTFFIFATIACLALVGIFSVPDLRDQVIMHSPLSSTFSAFGVGSATRDKQGYIVYRVRPGDSLESISQQFSVTIGGIYKLNGFYLGDEITVGEALKIPNDPAFGATYQPTAPPLPTNNSPAYPGAPAGTIFGGCLFCSIGGYSTGGNCAPTSQTARGFGLIQPDPNARFIRGFTWYHNGVDLSTGQYGTPIVAAQDGQLIFAGWDPYGFGLAIKVNHCWGLSTSYGHLGRLNVKVGQFVKAGQIIGLQGSTGNSTGPHLHFMVWWHNAYVNPLLYYDHLGFPY